MLYPFGRMKNRNLAIIAGITVAVAIIGSFAVISSMQSSNRGASNINPVSSSNIPVASTNSSSLVFPRDSTPYGLSYEQWATEWWKYFAAIPEADSPAADQTGEKCSANQNNTNAWFLVGVFQGKVTRSCEVPAGKALVGGFIGIECNERQDGPQDTLTQCAEEGPKYLKLAKLTIDGMEIPNVGDYKVTSTLSDISFPKGALWGAPEGNYALVGSTVMPIIKPLSTGKHTIAFQGIFDHPSNDVYDVAVDVTYNLIAK
jgi:hypothetical protein